MDSFGHPLVPPGCCCWCRRQPSCGTQQPTPLSVPTRPRMNSPRRRSTRAEGVRFRPPAWA
ncbi:unnamed protein product [Ectocarpus sp. CCAP 1310/34]|nr:unnamed protein product [Ectocarpus sp. CCAP 1310/34]